MIIFLTSLGHPQCCKDYNKVTALLEITLRSVFSQTDPDFKFIVVCNQVPDVKFSDQRLIYHIVDFPPRDSTGLTAIFRDKGTKLTSGFLFSRQFSPDYIFIIDADDWVNVNVVNHLHRNPSYPVWHVDGGYFVNYRTKQIKRKYGMNRYCGSTFIYTPDFLMKVANIKSDIDSSAGQDQLISATSETFIYHIIGDHQINYRYFTRMGVQPKSIPLRALGYIIETGENVSGFIGGEQGLPIDKRFCDEFGISESFISKKRASVIDRVRESLGCFRSFIGWLLYRKAGLNIYR